MGWAQRVPGDNGAPIAPAVAPLLPPVAELRGRWCVDAPEGLSCLSTVQVWTALAGGAIGPHTLVWRDGFGSWLRIAEVPELTDEPEESAESIPERSHIRLRQRRVRSGRPAFTRLSKALCTSFVCVVAGGALAIGLYRLTREPPVPQALSVGPAVRARADRQVRSARSLALERERDWWRARWR